MERLIRFLENGMPAGLRGWVERYFPGWRDSLRGLRRQTLLWLRGVLAAAVRLVILAVCVNLLTWGTLSFLAGVWDVYRHTVIGQVFHDEVSADLYWLITDLLGRDLERLSLRIIRETLLVSLILGGVAQLLAVRRLFHQARGAFVRVLWAMVCAKLASSGLTHTMALNPDTAFCVSLPPALALYGASFALGAKTLPELNPLALHRAWLATKSTAEIREAANRESLPR
ncbi:MAG: hypothetical protein ACOY3Z_08300 [Thermodesulfobacteriota bacterium]